jgi:hypothetical protein
MQKYLLYILLFLSATAYAQIPEDVLRYSYLPQNGTARSLAIGGAMASLGGDISSIYINPAGLGNYKTGEFIFSPVFMLNKNNIEYRDTKNTNTKNNFNIGTIGLVAGGKDGYNSTRSNAFAIAFTQTASYNNIRQYKGLNNYSSISEQWVEDVANSGLTIPQILNNPNYAFGTAPALYTFLVDTFTSNGNTVVKSLPEFLLDKGQALQQQKTIATSGGMYELALGYASNYNDKLLIGGSLGIPILNYKNTTTLMESDTSNIANNNFANFTYTDAYTTKGAGVNLKFGIIYRPVEHIRLGVAVHTPSYFFSLTDKRSTTLTANTENYNGIATATNTLFTNNQPNESKYSLLTPWRFLISGSYVLREIEDVTKQKGFITADIEYVKHGSSGFNSIAENPDATEIAYYKNLNKVIKSEYKGAFNFKLGGELKFNTIMARLGAAYYTNPYKDAALKANRLLLSGGIGYRHKGYFIDLTYVHSFNKDVDVTYRLQDKANTFATINNQRGNIALSFGIKF